MRILIVEDSPLVQKMYGLVFMARDHTLECALNGRAALELLAAKGSVFDLILLDLRMPDMDGVQFLEALRQRGPSFKNIPIVLTTAEPDDSVLVRQARALGVTTVVHKPWKPQDLREALKGLLSSEHPA